MNHAALIPALIEIARLAGDTIMSIYQGREGVDFSKAMDVQKKSDDSPVTAADLAAHNIIVAKLPNVLALPIISEEGELPPFNERAQWNSYWLIDPLDGTKEFIAGNGEFTVNIALIRNGRPILGVVHLPTTDITYVGMLGESETALTGAWKYQHGENPRPIRVRNINERLTNLAPLTVLVSHRHKSAETEELLQRLIQRWPGGVEIVKAGSSLKLCRIAEGAADLYPRLGPTSEWDIAAAQAVLEAAGGCVVQVDENQKDKHLLPLRYNTTDHLLNPYFYACGDQQFAWADLLNC